MINYLIESSVCLLVFYGFYLLFLQRDTFFERNRYYLLATALFSITVPLLELELWSSSESGVISTVFLSLNMEVNPSADTSMTWIEWLMVGYISVATFMILRVGARVSKLFIQAKKLKSISKNGYRLILTEGKMPTFAFLHFLFWNDKAGLEKTEEEKIVQHELAHIRGRHSLDILFMELVKALFWFNPVVYFFKTALSEQHEFIADAKVLRKSDSQAYRKLLVSSFLQNMNLQLVHSFNQPPIKKRIAMLEKSKTPFFSNFKLLMVVPIAAVLFLTYACSDSSVEESIERKAKILQSESDEVFEIVEIRAEPEGGIVTFLEDIGKELKYPDQAIKEGVEGKVYVQFVIKKDGSIGDVTILRGIGKGCDQEAKRVIESMPAWSPAIQDGKLVDQRIVVPINFKLS